MPAKPFKHSGRDAWTGAGKGDKPRHTFDENYRENFDAIKWSPKTGQRRFRKTYK